MIKTYEILKRNSVGELENNFITLLKNTKLLFNPDVIGNSLTVGHNHYLACFRKSDVNEKNLEEIKKSGETYDFYDLIFLVIDNIKFTNSIPDFYNTPEEFIKDFELDKYTIEIVKPNIKGDINNDDENVIAIYKIQKIISPYYIEAQGVFYNNIALVHFPNLKEMIINNSGKTIIYKNNDDKLNDAVNKTLRKLDQQFYKN